MAIGHHIGEKGRTIERRRIGGGELEEERNYFGMREGDLEFTNSNSLFRT